MTDTRSCFCQWSECKKFRQIILENAPNDHPWSTDIVRLTFPPKKNANPSIKSISWLVSIRRHLLYRNPDIDIPEGIHIYPHHFPLALLKWRQCNPKLRWSTLISKKDALEIVKYDYGNMRFMEYTNSMYYMLSKSSYAKDDIKQMLLQERRKLFHQSPMTTKSEIKTFIDGINRDSKVLTKLQTHFDFECTSESQSLQFTNGATIPNAKSIESNVSGCGDKISNHQSTNESDCLQASIITNEKSIPLLSGLGIGLGLSSTPIDINPNIVPPTIPNVTHLKDFLKKQYGSLKRHNLDFYEDNSVQEMAKLLVVYHEYKDSFIISHSDTMKYYPCHGYNLTIDKDKCSYFSLRKRNYDIVLCCNCQIRKDFVLRKRKRMVACPTRARPFSNLNPKEKVDAYEQRYKKVRSVSMRYNRLVSKLNNMEDSLIIRHNTPVNDIFDKVFDYISKHWNYSKSEINKMFLELELGTNDKTSSNIDERNKCVSYISENIQNMKNKLDGKHGSNRFSAHTINIALSLFLRSKRGYEDLRASGLICLPSPQALSKRASKCKVQSGGDPSIYLMLKDEISASPDDIVGHIMMDEIKLKNGISFNCKSKEIVGFIPEEMDTKNMLENILDMNKKHKKGKVVSVYANQWRFRSTKGLVHNSDFYFNNGSLNGNELVRQFIDVVTSYESIGIKIYGIVSDGGGGNTKIFNMISEYNPGKSKWMNNKCLRTLNPVDPSRYIYIWSCSTHSLKALRNNLYRSQPNLSRSLKFNNSSFGWKEMGNIYLRDVNRLDCNIGARTDIVKHAIHLDKYTLMNANYAKQVFSDKTICEVISHLSVMLQVKLTPIRDDMSQWHKFICHWKQLDSNVSYNKTIEIQSSISLLQYQISVNGIYIERLMNPRWRLTKDNIEIESKTFEEIGTYFDDWLKQQSIVKEKENMKESEVEKYFISLVTYNNMKTLVRGFLGYARCIINATGSYVPALHSNQSSIECFFSRIRYMGKDFSDKYASGVVQQNVLNQISSIQKKANNSSYPNNTLSNETNVKENRDKEIGLFVRVQKQIYDTMKNDIDWTLQESNTHIINPSHELSKKISGFDMNLYFQNYVLPNRCNYQQYLYKDLRFQGYVQLSIGTRRQRYFDSMLGKENIEATSNLCQDIVFMLYKTLCNSSNESMSSCAFEYNFLTIMQQNDNEVMKLYTSSDLYQVHRNQNTEPDRIFVLILTNVLKHILIEIILPDIIGIYQREVLTFTTITPMKDNKDAPMVINDNDVNRVFGWALMKTSKKCIKRKLNQNSDEKIDGINLLLEDMATEVTNIIHNKEYTRLFLPLDDEIRNKGRLTLVSPPYIKQFSQLLKIARETLNAHNQEQGNKVPVNGDIISIMQKQNAISQYPEITDICLTSLERVKHKSLTMSIRKEIIWELIDRICNALFGRVIRSFREDRLKRSNDITFRTEIAVKSESKHKN